MRLIDPHTAEKFVTIHSEDGKVFLLPISGKLKHFKSGVIITCRECNIKEIVNENSVCDRLKLCTLHARKKMNLKVIRRNQN